MKAHRRPQSAGLLLLALGLAFPFLAGNDYHLTVMSTAYIFAIATLGLNLITGYTGQFNLAHAGFMAIGAYTVGILTVDHQVPFWIAFALSGVVTAAVGLPLGYVSLRLKGHYFSIFTLCVGYILFLRHREVGEPDARHGRHHRHPGAGGHRRHRLRHAALALLPGVLLPRRRRVGDAAHRATRCSAAPSSPSATATSWPSRSASTCGATSCSPSCCRCSTPASPAASTPASCASWARASPRPSTPST